MRSVWVSGVWIFSMNFFFELTCDSWIEMGVLFDVIESFVNSWGNILAEHSEYDGFSYGSGALLVSGDEGIWIGVKYDCFDCVVGFDGDGVSVSVDFFSILLVYSVEEFSSGFEGDVGGVDEDFFFVFVYVLCHGGVESLEEGLEYEGIIFLVGFVSEDFFSNGV